MLVIAYPFKVTKFSNDNKIVTSKFYFMMAQHLLTICIS